MNKQTALDQYRAIFLATIDYLLEMAAGRVIIDQDDRVDRYYETLQHKVERHYQNGELEQLQHMMREIDLPPQLLQEESYIFFMKGRTGYDAEILKQILPDELPDYKRKGVFINEGDVSHKKLAEKYSPDNKRKLTIFEIVRILDHVVTYVDIHFEKSGASVYTVEGAGLDINVYWKDNNTIVIESRKDYVVKSKHVEQYQCLDDIVKVEYVVR